MTSEAPERYGRTHVSKIKAAYDELRTAVRSGDFDAAEKALDRYEQWADYVFAPRADPSPQWRPISEAEDGDRIIVAGWQHQSGGTIGYWWYHEDVAWDGKAIEHPSATHFTSISLPPFPEAPK